MDNCPHIHDRDNPRRVTTTVARVISRNFANRNYGAPKETRKSRKPVLRCRCAGKVGRAGMDSRLRVADECRKTGITLADRGVYDEHGLEPISGIFSSPEKSPPKRSETLTASESMEMQESTLLRDGVPSRPIEASSDWLWLQAPFPTSPLRARYCATAAHISPHRGRDRLRRRHLVRHRADSRPWHPEAVQSACPAPHA